jgi:hypothetical protein
MMANIRLGEDLSPDEARVKRIGGDPLILPPPALS